MENALCNVVFIIRFICFTYSLHMIFVSFVAFVNFLKKNSRLACMMMQSAQFKQKINDQPDRTSKRSTFDVDAKYTSSRITDNNII